MINTWDFKDANKIKVTTDSGGVFIGVVVTIDDASEYEDSIDNAEDMLSIWTDDGRAVGFMQSEIAKIVVLD